ncbi:MAG: hypothetical protein R3Y52_04410, partial [Psittacicella sp.]
SLINLTAAMEDISGVTLIGNNDNLDVLNNNSGLSDYSLTNPSNIVVFGINDTYTVNQGIKNDSFLVSQDTTLSGTDNYIFGEGISIMGDHESNNNTVFAIQASFYNMNSSIIMGFANSYLGTYSTTAETDEYQTAYEDISLGSNTRIGSSSTINLGNYSETEGDDSIAVGYQASSVNDAVVIATDKQAISSGAVYIGDVYFSPGTGGAVGAGFTTSSIDSREAYYTNESGTRVSSYLGYSLSVGNYSTVTSGDYSDVSSTTIGTFTLITEKSGLYASDVIENLASGYSTYDSINYGQLRDTSSGLQNQISINAAKISGQIPLIATNKVDIINNKLSSIALTPLIANNLSGMLSNIPYLTANTSGVIKNTSSMLSNASGMLNNYSGVENHYSSIANTYSGVLNNYSGILNNYSGILNNLSGVINNYSGILSNASGVANNYSGVENNYSGVENNYSGVANNYSGVLNNYSGILNNYSGILNNYSGILNNLSGITNNLSGIMNNASGIANNYSGILNNASGIANNASGVANNYSGIANNYSGVANNYSGIINDISGITNNLSGVANNYSGIENNYSGVENNYSGVENNYSGVANNYSGILNNYSGILNNYSGILNNLSGIANNLSGIMNNASGIANNYSGIENNYSGVANNYSGVENNYSGVENNYSGVAN